MVHPVTANRHPMMHELREAARVQAARRPDPPGDDEERGSQPSFDERRQRDVDVGGVSVVEAERDAGGLGDRVENRLERVDGDPVPLLSRLKDAPRRPDAVEADSVDDRFDDSLLQPIRNLTEHLRSSRSPSPPSTSRQTSTRSAAVATNLGVPYRRVRRHLSFPSPDPRRGRGTCRRVPQHQSQCPRQRRDLDAGDGAAVAVRPAQPRLSARGGRASRRGVPCLLFGAHDRWTIGEDLQPRGVVRARHAPTSQCAPDTGAARPEGLSLHGLLAERERRAAQPATQVRDARHRDGVGPEPSVAAPGGYVCFASRRTSCAPSMAETSKSTATMLGATAARHLVIVRDAETCYVIFRRDRRKKLPLFASIIYVSNPRLFRDAARHVVPSPAVPRIVSRSP